MDLSKELKVMLSNSNHANNLLIEELIEKQKEEQRLAEEKIHILIAVNLMDSLKKNDFKSLIDCGVHYIRLYVQAPGTNAYRADLLRIRFMNEDKKQLSQTEEELTKPISDIVEKNSGIRLYHKHTNKFANMYINLHDSIENIEEQILNALLAPHLKEIFLTNKMNIELENELSLNDNIKTNKNKI